MREGTLLGRFGVALGMASGGEVLYLLLVALLSAIFVTHKPVDVANSPLTVYLVNGQPAVQTLYNQSEWSFRSLDLKPLPPSAREIVASGVYLPSAAEAGFAEKLARRTPTWSAVGLSRQAIPLAPVYYIREVQNGLLTAYLAVYSNESRQVTVYIGRNGTSKTLPAFADRFHLRRPGELTTEQGQLASYGSGFFPVQDTVYLLAVDGCYSVDLKQWAVTKIVAADDLISIAAPAVYLLSRSDGHPAQALTQQAGTMLRGPESIYLVQNQRLTAKFTIPEALRDRRFLAYTANEQSIYYATSLKRVTPVYQADDVLQADAAGKVLQSWSVKQPPNPIGTPSVWDYLGSVLLLPSPLVMSLWDTIASVDMSAGQMLDWTPRWPSVIVLLTIGVMSCVVAWVLTARLYGKRVAGVWLLFTFIFGLPGLIGYLLHFRRRPQPVVPPATRHGTEILA